MTRTGVFVAAMALQFVVAGPALAADPIVGYHEPPYCVGHEATSLVVEQNIVDLRSEVARLMDEAVAVSHDQQWVYSAQTGFRLGKRGQILLRQGLWLPEGELSGRADPQQLWLRIQPHAELHALKLHLLRGPGWLPGRFPARSSGTRRVIRI